MGANNVEEYAEKKYELVKVSSITLKFEERNFQGDFGSGGGGGDGSGPSGPSPAF